MPGVATADVLHATTIGQNNSSNSEASVADVTITAGGQKISADFLMSRATASCNPDGSATASGSSEIVGRGSVLQPRESIRIPCGAFVDDAHVVPMDLIQEWEILRFDG